MERTKKSVPKRRTSKRRDYYVDKNGDVMTVIGDENGFFKTFFALMNKDKKLQKGIQERIKELEHEKLKKN